MSTLNSRTTPDSMTAVVCHGPTDYRLEVVSVAVPGPGDLLIRVEAVGICASDIKCFHGASRYWGDENKPAWAHTNVIPGHEIVGTIVAEGEHALAQRGMQVGDRVVVEQILPCGDCRYCLEGSYWMCQPQDIFGYKRHAQGAMAEYMLVPRNARIHRIDSSLPPAHAAFAEPLSCSLHAVERASIGFNDVVVVAGCGPIGLGMVVGARAKSPRLIIALDMSPQRLQIALDCGADIALDISDVDAVAEVLALTDGYGADVYLEASGHPAAVTQGLTMLRKMGTFVEYGIFGKEVTTDWSVISDEKELSILGAHLGPGCWEPAIRLIESGRLPLDRICSHQLPLDQFEEGFKLVEDGSASLKVTLIP